MIAAIVALLAYAGKLPGQRAVVLSSGLASHSSTTPQHTAVPTASEAPRPVGTTEAPRGEVGRAFSTPGHGPLPSATHPAAAPHEGTALSAGAISTLAELLRAQHDGHNPPSLLFVGTAHASDLFKTLCRVLHESGVVHHVSCPKEKQHLESASLCDPAKKRLRLAFLYRPTDEPLGLDKVPVCAGGNLSAGAITHIVYARGVLDLHHVHTPYAALTEQITARVNELSDAFGPKTRLVVYLPHRVYPHEPAGATPAARFFTLPPRICITLRRQKAIRVAIAEGLAATLINRAEAFDPWPLTRALAADEVRASWLGHHYPAAVYQRILQDLLVPIVSASHVPVAVRFAVTAASTAHSDDPAEPSAAMLKSVPATNLDVNRECDCMSYAPAWCEHDAKRRIAGTWPWSADKDATFAVSERRYPIPDEGADLDPTNRTEAGIGCGGVPFERRFVRDVKWQRVRLDDRTPFKPLLVQQPCNLSGLSAKEMLLPFFTSYPPTTPTTMPDLRHYKDEQCAYFFADNRRAQPYVVDVEQCFAADAVRVGFTGSSYAQNLVDGALMHYLSGLFGYHAGTHPTEDQHLVVKRPTNVATPGRHAVAFRWQAPDITLRGKSKRFFAEETWTDLVVCRAVQENTHFDRPPQHVFARYARDISEVMMHTGIPRTHIVLESAAWGRKPLPATGIDPCLNPRRGAAYREAQYCAARRAAATAKVSTPASALFWYDPFWLSAQDFAYRLAESDGHHMRGLPLLTEVLHILTRACGEAVESTPPLPTASDDDAATPTRSPKAEGASPLFSQPIEPLDSLFQNRVELFSLRDSRWSKTRICSCFVTSCSDAAAIEGWKEQAKQQHADRGWKRIDGAVHAVNDSTRSGALTAVAMPWTTIDDLAWT